MDTSTYLNSIHLVTSLTIGIQIYVLYLVRFHSPKVMDEYRYFLTTFTVKISQNLNNLSFFSFSTCCFQVRMILKHFDYRNLVILGAVFVPENIPNLVGSRALGPMKNFPPSTQLFFVIISDLN